MSKPTNQKIKDEIIKFEQKNQRLIPILLEHRLINEDIDYFDDYLIGGEEHA